MRAVGLWLSRKKDFHQQNALLDQWAAVGKQVCVDPRTSALNITLPAAELWRRRQISINGHRTLAEPAAIDLYLPPAPELQQTSCTLLPINGRTDGHRTVTQTLAVGSGQRQYSGRRPCLQLLCTTKIQIFVAPDFPFRFRSPWKEYLRK